MESTTASPHLVWSELDDEIIVVDTASGDFFSFNRTATEVWKGLEAGMAPDRIAESLADTYGISRAQAMTDVQDLIREFRDMKLRV